MRRNIFPFMAAMVVALAPLAQAQSLAAADNTRLAALVPASLSPEDACRGFRDLGDCSAALHASQNLNIPFVDLKDRLVSGQPLPAAIHAFKPNVDARREAQRAQRQAHEDLTPVG